MKKKKQCIVIYSVFVYLHIYATSFWTTVFRLIAKDKQRRAWLVLSCVSTRAEVPNFFFATDRYHARQFFFTDRVEGGIGVVGYVPNQTQ